MGGPEPGGPNFAFCRIDDYVGNSDYLWNNFNPCTPVNINHNLDGNWTCCFAGGMGSSDRGDEPFLKMFKPNPNVGTDGKPLWLQHIYMGNIVGPVKGRYAAIIGDWMYWGGYENWIKSGVGIASRRNFYRIHVPSLRDNNPPQVLQQSCPQMPAFASADGLPDSYYSCVLADRPRRRIIFVDWLGICVLQIPTDDAISGMQWYGPFQPPNWTNVNLRPSTGSLHGIRAIHRSDLGPFGQTFTCGNISHNWNRLRWTN
jgi:hypothetical protein